jgi:uncharacterized protein YneF (UPF0154 family)
MEEGRQTKSTGRTVLIVVLIALVAVLGIIAAIIGAFYLSVKKTLNKEPQVTSATITQRLSTVAELSTAELEYNGLIKYQEGEIPLLTQTGYSMVYKATVKAGIKDISQTEVEVSDTEVIVRLPEITVLDVSVDEDSVEFYDQKYALLNWTDQSDGVDAIKRAEDDVRENADIASLKQTASDQSVKVVEELLKDNIGDRKLTVVSTP